MSERKTAQPRSPPNHRFSRHLRGPWEKEGHSSACAGTGLRGGRRHGGCTWPAPASASLGCVCAEELPDCDVPPRGRHVQLLRRRVLVRAQCSLLLSPAPRPCGHRRSLVRPFPFCFQMLTIWSGGERIPFLYDKSNGLHAHCSNHYT